MIGHRLALLVFLLVILQGFLLLAQEVQQDGESVCDCTEPCTEMVEPRVLAIEQHWKQRMQSLEESFRKDREVLEAICREEINALEAASEDAKQVAASLQQAHETVASLQAENDKFTSEYSQLQRHVKLLIQDKQRLQQSIEELAQELDEYKRKVRILTNKNFESSRDLLHANERLRELDKEYFRINTKLIWRDAQSALLEQVNKPSGLWNYVCGWMSPFLEFAIQVLLGIWSDNAALIDDINLENVLHKLHIQPILDNRIYPIQRHLVESRRKVLDSFADCIQYRSQSILSYVRLLEGESKSREALLRALEYSETHSEKVARILERMLCIFAAFWLVAGLVAWRRHRSKRLPDAVAKKESVRRPLE